MLDRIKAFVDMDGSGFEIGAKRIESVAEKMGHNITHHLKGAILGAIGVAAIEQAIHRTIELGAHITDLAKRVGMTAEKFQELSFAFKTTGGSEEGMISFLERLSTSREKALSGSMAAPAMLRNFARLGVSQDDLKTKRSDELMGIIGKAIQEGSIESLRGPLRSVGGKGAGELIGGFKAGIEEKAAEARHAGQVMGGAVAFQMKELEERGKMLATHLATVLAPTLVTILKKFEDFTDHLKQFGAWLGGLTSQFTASNFKKEAKNPLNWVGGPGMFPILAVKNLLSKGHEAALDALQDANDEIIQRREEDEKRIQEATKAPRADVDIPPPPDAKEKKTKSEHEKEVQIDSLQRIGGFTGAGAEMPIVSIAREQLVVLKSIDRKVTPTATASMDEDSLIDE